MLDHSSQLTAELGMEDGPEIKFLTSVLIAMSTSKMHALFLKVVSAYTNITNTKMAPCGFEMLAQVLGFYKEDSSNC